MFLRTKELGLIAAAMVLAFASSAMGATPIVISEVHPSGSGNGTYGADWFELTNTTGAAIDITGWRMDDNSDAFASSVPLAGVTSIAAGQSVVFVEVGSGLSASTVTDAFKYAWFGTTIPASFTIGTYSGAGVGLSTGADHVNIFDSTGVRQTGVAFNGSTNGTTFDNSAGIGSTTTPLPVISTLSVVGTNGASKSFDGSETGSPGTITQPSLPIVSIGSINAAAAAASEVGPVAGTLRFARTGVLTSSLTVNYTVATGPGQASNSDYTESLTGTVTIPIGASSVDQTITPNPDGLPEGPETVSLIITPDPSYSVGNSAPVTIADSSQVAFTGLPTYLSGAIGDPQNPTYTFTVNPGAVTTSQLKFTVTSSDTVVAPLANIVFTTNGNNVTVKVTPPAVGFSDISITAADPTVPANNASSVIHYGASGLNSSTHSTAGVPTLGTTTRYFYGMSNASGAVTVPGDPNTFIIADDEPPNNKYVYDIRQSSYPIITPTDFSPGTGAPLNLPVLNKECDFEGLMLIGTRAYYMGSQSNDSSNLLAPNRGRLFAVDLAGTGTSTTLTFAGRYDNLRNQIINWDHTNVHGLGIDHYGLFTSSVGNPKLDTGYDLEGLAPLPSSLTAAFMAFRAPIVGTGKHALVLSISNFSTMATSLGSAAVNDPACTSGTPGTTSALGTAPTFNAPIELDLGGRGVRDIVRNSFDEYLIIGGSTGDPANTKDFRLFTWDGISGHPAIMLNNITALNQAGMTPEGILAPLPAGHLSTNPQLWLLSDNGTVDFYGDGLEAKDEPQNLQKSRADLVNIGTPVVTIFGSFPSTVVNSTYSQQLTATESTGTATGSATFSILTGSLPPGLNISGAGLVSGTPTTAGAYTFTVLASYSDGQGLANTKSFTLTIVPTVNFTAVAAGDVTASDVILWTRIQEAGSVLLTAQLSKDPNFVTFTTAIGTTDPIQDNTVKINPTGLTSGARYFYRFVGPNGELSTVGTFKTAYAANVKAAVHFAFSGDADGKWRPFPLVANIAAQQLDFFEFCGDTMYENANTPASGTAPASGVVTAPEVNSAQTLADLRRKYRENITAVTTNGNAGLKNFFAAQANYTLLDNHELCSNVGTGQYQCGGAPQFTPDNPGVAYAPSNTTYDANTTGNYANKTAGFIACQQAFRNYEPIREHIINAPGDPRSNGTQQMYNAQQWGKNLLFVNTDDRSYADIRMNVTTARADNPLRTRLGATQLAWLEQALLNAQTSGTPWKIVTVSDPIDQQGPIGGALANGATDSAKSWMGGYRAERNALLKFIADNKITNVVFLATDDHQNRVNEILYVPDPVNAPTAYAYVPSCFSVVAGPIGASGPEMVVTDHSLGSLKAIADLFANQQKAAGVNPIGLDPAYPGLHDVVRENDPNSDTLRQPIDFYSPDTFNYATLDISSDGKTLTVSTFGINAYFGNGVASQAPNNVPPFREPSVTGPERQILSFQVDANVSAISLAASGGSGNAGSAIPLTITPTLASSFPQTVNVTISGVPATSTLSAGTNAGGGVWNLTSAQLPGLKLTSSVAGNIPLTVTATDLDGSNLAIGAATANLSVTVTANPVPIAFNGNLTVTGTTATTGTLNAMDPDGEALTFAIVANGAKGTATVTNTSTGAFTYTATAEVAASTTDTFTFKASDANGTSNVATVTVTILPSPTAPTGNATVMTTGTILTGSTVQFSAGTSSPNSVFYVWDFGDGTQGFGVTPNHTYASAGTYTVTMTPYNSQGIAGTPVTMQVVIAAAVPPAINTTAFNGKFSKTGKATFKLSVALPAGTAVGSVVTVKINTFSASFANVVAKKSNHSSSGTLKTNGQNLDFVLKGDASALFGTPLPTTGSKTVNLTVNTTTFVATPAFSTKGTTTSFK